MDQNVQKPASVEMELSAIQGMDNALVRMAG